MEYPDNKWAENETDEEYNQEEEEEEYEQNETPPETLNDDFVNNILGVKHSLYDNIVLAPQLGTEKAQSKDVLQEYLNRLNDVYVMSVKAQSGNRVNGEQVNVFPEGSRQAIIQTLDWITDYFSKNRIPDTIPYSDYIRKSLHDYQFVQRDSFE